MELVNAIDGSELIELTEGAIVDPTVLQSTNVDFRANFSPGVPPGSVHFELSGAKAFSRTSNQAPHALYGTDTGDGLGPGTYVLSASVYEDPHRGGSVLSSHAVSFTVSGPELSSVSIEAAAPSVTEGAAAVFALTRTAPTTATLEVPLTVSETGEMLSGAGPFRAVFAVGSGTAEVLLATSDDVVVEADSTVTATLTAGTGYTVSTASSASVTVEDDDTAAFTVSAEPEAIDEGESATLTVAISNGVTFAEAQTISLATSGTASASDYSGVPSTLTLAAGASSARAELAATADREEEGAETVTVTASHGGAEIGSATVTIHSVSHDATLSALSLSGIDIGTFAAATTAYTVSVAHDTSGTTVTATAAHSAAAVSIQPGPEVNLAVGANEITVTVTAEDGETTQAYTVTVTREGPL